MLAGNSNPVRNRSVLCRVSTWRNNSTQGNLPHHSTR
jgi:hypothetical protein